MKRSCLIWSFIFIIVLSSGAIAQQTCSSIDDTIFKISSQTNAHGETFGGSGSYNFGICYSTLFGQTAPTNPDRTCLNSGELVLRLSGATNAHAEIPDANNPVYTQNICYQGLSCYSSTNGCGSDVRVVGLSGSTNAHLEEGSSGSYQTSICCSVPPIITGSLSSPEWRDYADTKINQNGIVCVNNWVKTFSLGSGLPDGTSVNVEVYDKDAVSDDLITSFQGTVLNGKVSIAWNILSSQLSQGGIGGAAEGDFLELYFIISEAGSSVQSYEILATEDTSLCLNSGPNAKLVGPVHKGIYFVNDPINFVGQCGSSLGPSTYGWKIYQNGQEIKTENSQSFTYTYTNDGQSIIELECTDMFGKKSYDQIGIVVASGSDVLVYANEPEFRGVVYNVPPSVGPYFPEEVSFSAEDTIAVLAYGATGVNNFNCVGSCLAGDCPLVSEGTPVGCSGPINIKTISQVNSELQASGFGAIQLNGNHDDLEFDWKFWDSDWSDDWASFEGRGIVSGMNQYDDLSNKLNDKHISVGISIKPNTPIADFLSLVGQPPIADSFQREFTLGRCLNNGNDYLDSDGNLQSTSTISNACTGGDNLPGTFDDCCPSGQACGDFNGDGDYNCDFLNTQITVCGDYGDKVSCEGNSDLSVPKSSLGYETGQCEYAECYWSDSTSSCKVKISQFGQSSSGCLSSGPNACVQQECVWETIQSDCVNGQKRIDYVVDTSFSGSVPSCLGSVPNCQKAPIIVPCGSLSFELPFFGIIQFIAVSLIVALVYFTLLEDKNE